MPPHENHRTVIAVLAGVIAVVASAAGTSVFVVGSLTAAPGPSVPVAPVVHLPRAPSVSAPVAAPGPKAPTASAARSVLPAPSRTAVPTGPTVLVAASGRTARLPLPGATRVAFATPSAGSASVAAQPVVLTAADLLARQIVVARVVTQSTPVAGPVSPEPVSTAVLPQPSAPLPQVSLPTMAKVAAPKGRDLGLAPAALRLAAAHAAERAAHALAEQAALAARPGYGDAHLAKHDEDDLSPTVTRPTATVAPVVPQPAGPARTGHGDGKHAVHGDGPSGPSAHH